MKQVSVLLSRRHISVCVCFLFAQLSISVVLCDPTEAVSSLLLACHYFNSSCCCSRAPWVHLLTTATTRKKSNCSSSDVMTSTSNLADVVRHYQRSIERHNEDETRVSLTNTPMPPLHHHHAISSETDVFLPLSLTHSVNAFSATCVIP